VAYSWAFSAPSAVIASGVTVEDRVVTTGFANLSEGAKVSISRESQAPTPDLAPRKQRPRRGEARGEQTEQGAAPKGEKGQKGDGAKAPQ